jgi:hypothetical protein
MDSKNYIYSKINKFYETIDDCSINLSDIEIKIITSNKKYDNI